MLNRHDNLLIPRSDRLRVGNAVVDIPRRQVTLPDGAISRLTHKALQVLLMLVNHKDHVVSRETILEWVWSDTMPTNDVVTQAITHLRRALSDDATAPRFVETIAKTGYRLIASIEWLPDADDGAEPFTDSLPEQRDVPRAKTSMYLIAGIAAVALVTILGVLLIAVFADGAVVAEGGTVVPSKRDTPEIKVRNLTSGPAQEWIPRLSPDGSMVAYVLNDPMIDDGQARIMVQASTLTAARQLTTPKLDESDAWPAWAPDGRHIAFKRYAIDGKCMVMIVPASGGVERSIADCENAGFIDWTADGEGLIASADIFSTTSAPSVLRILDISVGHWRDLVYERAPDDVDLEPRYSPDGKWIGFRRNFALTDLWKIPSGGGKAVRLTHLEGDIRGWDWTPDNRAIVFNLFAEGRMGLQRLDLASGRVDWLGVKGAMMPDVAGHPASVVFSLDRSTTSLYRYRMTPSDSIAAVEHEPLFPSSSKDVMPVISPDGSTLAYLSDRSGDLQLWMGEPDRPETLHPIENLHPIPRHPPVWSADGSQLLVVGFDGGSPWLYEVHVASARATRVDLDGATPVYAAYLLDGDRLVGVDEGGGALQLRRYRVDDGRWKPVTRLQGVSAVRVDEKSGKLYFTQVGKSGLWRMNADFSSMEQVSDSLPTVMNYKTWQVSEGVVWYLGMRKGCFLWWHPLNGDDVSRAGICLAEQGERVIPNASRDGAWIYAWRQDTTNMDVGWAELPPL